MVEVINISKSYKKNACVLEDITLRIRPNAICCLLGKNGTGKSTLLNIIACLVRQDAGEILINCRQIKTTTDLISEGIGMVSQFDYLINQLSGYQYLNFQSLLYRLSEADRETRIKTLSEYFFDEPRDLFRLISSYSSGMRMKLRIIASLIHKPSILLLDEPFAHLDPVSSEKLVVLLQEFSSKDSNIVLASSHDLMYVDKLATQICVLDNRKVVFDGSKDAFTQNDSRKIDKLLLDLLDKKNSSTNDISWLLKS